MNRIEELVVILTKARDKYYNDPPSELTDAEFDTLEEELYSLDTENNFFNKVGASTEEGEKVIHEIPMLSLAKEKTPEGVAKWMRKLALTTIDYVIEPKVDSISGRFQYIKGDIHIIASRGDGHEGSNLTHLKDYLSCIPKQAFTDKDKVDVRGEFYIPKDSELDLKGSPRRNLCWGILNRKDDFEDIKYIKFIAYQVTVDGFDREYSKISYLGSQGFEIPEIWYTKDPSDPSFYQNYMDTFRDKWNFESDGLVVVVDDCKLHEQINSRWVVRHHPHYAVALKPETEKAQTILREIEWNVSRQGNIVPVGIFDEVFLANANITRATLNNYRNVINLKLERGDTILVERANEVIPKIIVNLTKHEIYTIDYTLLPERCLSCGFPLDIVGVHLHCSNKECPEQEIQRIVFWVMNANLDGVSEGIIRRLYEAGLISKIKDLYSLTKDQLLVLEGFQDSLATKVIKAIEKSRRMKFVEVISKLGIPLVGERALLNKNITTVQSFIDFQDDLSAIGKNITSWKSDQNNIYLLYELLSALIIENPTEALKAKTDVPLVGLTGAGPKGRKELIKELESKGYTFTESITKSTKFLVCEDVNGESTKLKRARQLGITLVSYEEFFK